jgi:hypothetical protein
MESHNRVLILGYIFDKPLYYPLFRPSLSASAATARLSGLPIIASGG